MEDRMRNLKMAHQILKKRKKMEERDNHSERMIDNCKTDSNAPLAFSPHTLVKQHTHTHTPIYTENTIHSK